MPDQDRHPLPLFLKLEKRRVLVVGGYGEVAEKCQALLEAGADLTLIAEEAAPFVSQAAQEGRLLWKQRQWCDEDLKDIFLIVSVMESAEDTEPLFQRAEERSILMNAVDQPRFCSLIWPARIDRPPVTVAFSTNGHSPALAGYLRSQLERLLPENMGPFADWLSKQRALTRDYFPDLAARGRFWRGLFQQGLAERFLAGETHAANTMIQRALEKQEK
ncbi:MAG: bifunctional precorrin-2 dehydrogenase/sirohydrochlorin ferrochelatase [Magnetococcales bacterium]|nr:bifunctional precorrin-2 dehydrogenase/sirohydrochlorin ferrochelatase [Magnetococcales bacterium]